MEQLIATYLPCAMDAIGRLERTRKRARADRNASSGAGEDSGGDIIHYVKRKRKTRPSPINVSSPPDATECIDLT